MALALGVAGGPILAVALLQTREASKIISVALLQMQQAKTADHDALLIDTVTSRLKAFERISGSEGMVLIEQHNTDISSEFGDTARISVSTVRSVSRLYGGGEPSSRK